VEDAYKTQLRASLGLRSHAVMSGHWLCHALSTLIIIWQVSHTHRRIYRFLNTMYVTRREMDESADVAIGLEHCYEKIFTHRRLRW
jgi:hypothetical protein